MHGLASVAIVVGVLACTVSGRYGMDRGMGGPPKMPPMPPLMVHRLSLACDSKPDECKQCLDTLPTLRGCFPNGTFPRIPTEPSGLRAYADAKEEVVKCIKHICKISMVKKMIAHKDYDAFIYDPTNFNSHDEVQWTADDAKNHLISRFQAEAENAMEVENISLKEFMMREMKETEQMAKRCMMCTMMEKKAEMISFLGCIGESFPDINPMCGPPSEDEIPMEMRRM